MTNKNSYSKDYYELQNSLLTAIRCKKGLHIDKNAMRFIMYALFHYIKENRNNKRIEYIRDETNISDIMRFKYKECYINNDIEYIGINECYKERINNLHYLHVFASNSKFYTYKHCIIEYLYNVKEYKNYYDMRDCNIELDFTKSTTFLKIGTSNCYDSSNQVSLLDILIELGVLKEEKTDEDYCYNNDILKDIITRLMSVEYFRDNVHDREKNRYYRMNENNKAIYIECFNFAMADIEDTFGITIPQ